MSMELMVYVARISEGSGKELDDLHYVTRNDGVIAEDEGQTRFLSFYAESSGYMPSAVRIDGVHSGDSLGFARERLYMTASGNKECSSGIGFITDAAFASEYAQLELISRISSLLFRPREELAAVPWTHFKMLAVEMTQKGVVLLRDGWCKEAVFDEQLAPLFEEITECLKYKRPKLSFGGVVQ